MNDKKLLPSFPRLPTKPLLKDFHKYCKDIVKIRGFDKEPIAELFMLFMEECGELAKAARDTQVIKSGTHSKQRNLAHEAADVFIYLLEICNYFDINLEQAFREKEIINSKRTYK